MVPEISVIIPAYNASLFIADAINAVLTQRYRGKIEIIVIDDGSSDDTKAIVSGLAGQYHQIVLVSNKRTKGPSGARNTGLLKATGTYVAFLDADDIWLPNHLEEGIGFLERNHIADVVFYNCEVADLETKEKIGDWFARRDFTKTLKTQVLNDRYHLICDNMFTALLAESFMHLQSMIIRKEVLAGIMFNEDIRHSEDRDFSIRLYANAYARFAFKDIITGVYFRHQNSLTGESIENELHTNIDQIRIFSGYLSDYSLDDVTVATLRKLIFEKYMSASYNYRKLNNHNLSLLFWLKSFKYKIALSQASEFSKIVVSLVYSKPPQ